METQLRQSNVERPKVNPSETTVGNSARQQEDTGSTNAPLASTTLDVEELHARCMGNLHLVHRVLDKFRTRFPEDMTEIRHAVENGDAGHVARIAHRLKGTSASVSAKGLAEAAADLERLGKADTLENVDAYVNQLDNEWKRFKNETETTVSSPKET